MASNLAIDDSLLLLAKKVGGLKTKKETVNMTLKEFIQRRRQEEVIMLFGTVPYDSGYDYKKERDHS
jgi:Bacterial antitoxin of type II TA system, VapB